MDRQRSSRRKVAYRSNQAGCVEEGCEWFGWLVGGWDEWGMGGGCEVLCWGTWGGGEGGGGREVRAEEGRGKVEGGREGSTRHASHPESLVTFIS